MQDYIESVIRPLVQGDGGEIRFVSFENDVLVVKMQGECSVCGLAGGCLKEWLGAKLRAEFGREIKIVQRIARPYFADK